MQTPVKAGVVTHYARFYGRLPVGDTESKVFRVVQSVLSPLPPFFANIFRLLANPFASCPVSIVTGWELYKTYI